MQFRRFAVLAVPLLLGGALSGCGGSSGAGAAGSGGSGSGDCKIALLLPENATPRYEAADKPYFEAEVAKQASDCEVLYFNAANDGNKQKQQAETALTQGAKVLVLGSADSEAAAAIVEEAAAKGVKTINYDRFSGGPVAFLVTFDALKVGQLQGQALVDAMKAAGAPAGSQVVMINGDTSGFEAKLFKKGAHEAIDASGFTVGAEYDTKGWAPDTATTEMSQAITKLGKDKIKGVYVANDTMAGAAINAMQQAGIKALPPVTGQDAAVDGLQRVLLGTQTMTVYKALKLEGTAAADIAVAVATGKALPAGSGTETNSTGDKVPVQYLEPTAVTAENMKDTVVKDGFVKATELCAGAVAAKCTELGIS